VAADGAGIHEQAQLGDSTSKLWGGRFNRSTSELVDELNASIGFDRRFARHDILGSIAHARMLARQGVIGDGDAAAIEAGLRQIADEIAAGRHEFRQSDEDIHMSVERRLREIIGEPAGRLHTGRSRNDQVALDFRLWTRQALLMVAAGLVDFSEALIELAGQEATTVMPGFTHLQHAQPVLLAHHLLAYVEMALRDLDRLRDAYRRANISPLGAGALAATTYPLDTSYTAELLGFERPFRNSLDAVGDRDFALDFLSAGSIIMVHLSRLAEELIIWSTSEFGFIELDDAFATGSSIMPQKKNPDVAELVRGKTGRVFGNLMGLLTATKALPLAYNKDLQEDKEGVFDTFDTLGMILRVLPPMLRSTRFNRGRMASAAAQGFIMATDVADHLVRQGLPFREAHEIVGTVVAYCVANTKDLPDLAPEEWARFSPSLRNAPPPLTVEDGIRARETPGGPGYRQVAKAREVAMSDLEGWRGWLDARRDELASVAERLNLETLVDDDQR